MYSGFSSILAQISFVFLWGILNFCGETLATLTAMLGELLCQKSLLEPPSNPKKLTKNVTCVVKNFILAIFVDRSIKPLAKILQTQITEFFLSERKSLKLKFVCSQIPPL